MENEISFKAIAEVQADHDLALFGTLDCPDWSQSCLLCYLVLLIQHKKEWDVKVATQDHFVTEGWKLIDDFLRYIPGLTVRHRALESPREIPFFFITFCSWFVCASLQRLALCSTNFYNIMEDSVLLSHFLSPMHKEQNGTRYVRPTFLHLSFQVFSSLF